MKLYRIDWEYDEYLGAGEWETKHWYEYVVGNRQLGKHISEKFHSPTYDNDRVINVVILSFSFRALWVCLKNVQSSYYNQTSRKEDRIYEN